MIDNCLKGALLILAAINLWLGIEILQNTLEQRVQLDRGFKNIEQTIKGKIILPEPIEGGPNGTYP